MILSFSRKRRQVYFLLYASGLSQMALRLRTPKHPLVFLAHRVIEGWDPVENLQVDSRAAINKNDFERRIRFLVSHFRPKSMADYLAGTAGPNSFTLTFDDGYRDNFTLALPVLRHYHVPMHLFVTTGFVNGQVSSWVERVARACGTVVSGSHYITSLGMELHFAGPDSRSIGFNKLCRAMKVVDRIRIEKALAEIENMPGASSTCDCNSLFLSPSDLVSEDHLVSFGAHSVTHANFRLLDRAAVVSEAENSRQWLEDTTSQPISTFAYPYGFASDYSRDYFCQELSSPVSSWRHIFGTGDGRAGDPLEDKRLNLNLQPFYVFHVQVSGVWELLRRKLKA